MANKKILTNLTVQGDTQSDSFVKDNGLSSEFLKADGSVDSTVYAPESHDHLRILATDDRDVKPNATSVGSTIRGIQPFFTSLGGMTGSANTNYQDLLVFDTYQDSSGGFANAMTLDKSDGSMRIWNAASFATSWGTPKRVWTDDDFSSVPTYTAGDGLLLDGTEFKVNGDSLAGSIDLDTMRTTGTFPQNSNANATSGSNYPEDLAGMLEVINDDFGNGLLTIQRYTMYNTSRVWSRRYYNGTWSTWVDMTLNSTYNLSGYLLNTTDTLTGDLTVTGSILAKGAITNSSAALQVNGFQRTGNIYLHSGGNTPNTASPNVVLSNILGKLVINQDVSADNLSGTNTGDQDLSGYLTNTTDTLTGILTIDGQALISNTFPTLDFVDTNSFTDTADRFRVRAGINNGQIQWYDDSTSSLIEMMSFDSTGYVSIGDVAQNGYQTTIASLGTGSLFTYGKIFTLNAIQAVGTVTGSNLSGTNTGDQDLSSYLTSLSGAVLTTTNQNIGGNKTFDDLVHMNTDDDSGYQLTVGVANSLYSIFALGRIYSQADIGASTMSVINDITAGGFKTPSGTSSQFLKADGSVDSTVYTGDQDLSGYLLNTTDTLTGTLTVYNGSAYITPIAYGSNQDDWVVKAGAYNNAAFDQGLKLKSTSTGSSYMAFDTVSNANTLTMRSGKVGIGTEEPTSKLDVSGDGRFTSTVTATNFILSSDSRLKDNVEEVDNKHIDVNWKTFEMKSEKGQSRYGVIAQELEEVHPEFVRTDDEGMKSVAYVDLLIAKNAELEARLEKLERLLLDK